MKEIIRKILREEYKKMSSLPKNIIISIYDDINITLYDYVNSKVLGFVGLSKSKDGTYYFPSIAAEKGLGPTVLEIALMFCHPNGLMVSRDGDIRGDAFNVWQKMYYRDDVIKETLPLEDKKFNFAIISGEEEEYESVSDKIEELNEYTDDGFKEAILVYNTKMSMTPTKDYYRLIKDGILLDHHQIFIDGRDFFTLKYNYE
jgi:hypothetical protein